MNFRRIATLPVAGCFLLTIWLQPLVLSVAQAAGVAEVPQVSEPFTALSQDNAPTDLPVEVYHGSFFYSTRDSMLAALKVQVNPRDWVTFMPDPSLGIGSEIHIVRAGKITVQDGGSSQVFYTRTRTESDFIKEQNIVLNKEDIITPDLTSKLTWPTGVAETIKIVRVAESQVKVIQSIDFTVTRQADDTLEKGKEVTDQYGQKGTKVLTYQVVTNDGVEQSRTLVDTQITKKAVNQIVRYGTKIIHLDQGLASWYGGVPAGTAAHRTLPFGTKVEVCVTGTTRCAQAVIDDRGPFVPGRVIDLSPDVFAKLASLGSGVVSVVVNKISS